MAEVQQLKNRNARLIADKDALQTTLKAKVKQLRETIAQLIADKKALQLRLSAHTQAPEKIQSSGNPKTHPEYLMLQGKIQEQEEQAQTLTDLLAEKQRLLTSCLVNATLHTFTPCLK